jgi:hypothetical protein
MSPTVRERASLNVHAVLNLLNRLVATEDNTVREELVSRLAEYMAAAHRVEAGARLTLAGLCELTRSYAAMRFLMADAIEPRIDCSDGDLSLRTEQSAEMMAFLQRAVDSLLATYTARLDLSIRLFAWWQIELTLSIASTPGQEPCAPDGWSPSTGDSGFTRSARFTAIARPSSRI